MMARVVIKALPLLVLALLPLMDYVSAAGIQTLETFDSLNSPQAPKESQLLNSYIKQPQTAQLLKDSVGKVTQLINAYRQNGLSNMPSLPNVPGLNTVMTVPDKLLRAELSMLQDEIKMAQDMMQNPVYATMNVPREFERSILIRQNKPERTTSTNYRHPPFVRRNRQLEQWLE